MGLVLWFHIGEVHMVTIYYSGVGMALSVGDEVKVDLCGQFVVGRVISLEDWVYIAVRTVDGHIYISVCMNMSAVSWSRIVRLGDGFPIENVERCQQIAQKISWHPKRVNVADVPGAKCLLKPEACLILDKS